MGRPNGKVALISGGARDSGSTEAQLFCREGAQVVFGDVLDDNRRKVAGKLHATGGKAQEADSPLTDVPIPLKTSSGKERSP